LFLKSGLCPFIFGRERFGHQKICEKPIFCPEKVGYSPFLEGKSGQKKDGIWRNLAEFSGI
jgi:hypothetical protein